jgi:hypothetical protein
MYLNIHTLEIANGLKDALIHADFTIESILNSGSDKIASIMGIDPYVAEIIFNAAKKAVKSNAFIQKNYYNNNDNDNAKSLKLIDERISADPTVYEGASLKKMLNEAEALLANGYTLKSTIECNGEMFVFLLNESELRLN